MKDYILHKKILKEVEAGRVSQQRCGNLSIFKYAPETHFGNYWNEINRQCRGIIIADDSTIVARPFPKFFNLGELPETHLEHLPKLPYIVEEKLDGSLGIGYLVEDEWKLATPGSLTSDQAIMGTRILREYDPSWLPVYATPLFEILYPENRIVVDYGQTSKLVLLTIIDHNGKEWPRHKVDEVAYKGRFDRPKIYTDVKIDDIVFPQELREGYVVRFENDFRVKIKDPRYVQIHKLLNYMSHKGVIELLCGHEYRATIENCPKEIQRSFDDIRAMLQLERDIWTSELEIYLLKLESHNFQSRKETALWIQSNVPREFWGFIFMKLDNKIIAEEKIWQQILERMK